MDVTIIGAGNMGRREREALRTMKLGATVTPQVVPENENPDGAAPRRGYRP